MLMGLFIEEESQSISIADAREEGGPSLIHSRRRGIVMADAGFGEKGGKL